MANYKRDLDSNFDFASQVDVIDDDIDSTEFEPLDDAAFFVGDDLDAFDDDFDMDELDDEFTNDEDDQEEDYDLYNLASNDTVGLYLKEMARVPLLNTDEEVQLAIRIEAGHASDAKLRKDPNSSRAVEWKFLIEDGNCAREHLIKANTRLVVSVAKKYMSRGVPFLDLIQEGNLGLMKAVEKFDYRRGFRFSTYATWWIRQTITRAIADQGRTIRVPVHSPVSRSDDAQSRYVVMTAFSRSSASTLSNADCRDC